MAGNRIIRHGRAQRAAVRALEDALDPISDAHENAVDAYAEAVDAHRTVLDAHRDVLRSGDEEAIERAKAVCRPTADALRAAKQAKVAAANHLDATRTWLRREAEIRKLQDVTIPKLVAILSGPMLVKHGAADAREDPAARAEVEEALEAARAELAEKSDLAAAVRAELEALGGVVVGDPAPPDLPPGSADVGLSPITVKTRVHRSRGDN